MAQVLAQVLRRKGSYCYLMKQLIDFYKRKGAKTTYAGQDKYLVWRLGQNAQCQPKQAELIPIPM